MTWPTVFFAAAGFVLGLMVGTEEGQDRACSFLLDKPISLVEFKDGQCLLRGPEK